MIVLKLFQFMGKDISKHVEKNMLNPELDILLAPRDLSTEQEL